MKKVLLICSLQFIKNFDTIIKYWRNGVTCNGRRDTINKDYNNHASYIK